MHSAVKSLVANIRFRRFVLLGLLLPFQISGFAQKYNFKQYDIEDGLAQSQVLKIYQDKNHYLWFGSYGGVSRFDGKDFFSYTKSDGLLDNIVTVVLKDRKDRVWLGTEAGLTCINGKRITTIAVPGNADKSWIKNMAEDQQGRLWLIKKSKLYNISNGKIKFAPVKSPSEYAVTLTTARTGKLYLSICGDGIYAQEGNKWIKKVAISDSVPITKIVPDRVNQNKLYLLSPKQVYTTENGILAPYRNALLETVHEPYFAMEQDAEGTLWVGTNNGAYYLKKDTPVHFTSSNGFTNNAVNDIYLDYEDNIWLATDAAGVYKFSGDAYTSYDKFDGTSHIIMGMAKDDFNTIWLASFNNGLLKYDGKNFKHTYLPSLSPYSKNVNCVYNVPGKGLLIGTQQGLWQFDGKVFKHLTEGQLPQIVRSVVVDKKGTIWMAAPAGCFYLDGTISKHAGEPKYSATAVIEAGSDSILAGTNHGIFLLKNKIQDQRFVVPALDNSSVLCLLKYQRTVLVGTFGDGLFIVDLKNKKVKKFNVKNGFFSNDIYSLTMDNNGYVWAGTGRGVNKFSVDAVNMSVQVVKETTPKALIECNQNSMFKLDDKIWVGATKGLYIYNAAPDKLEDKKPFINIQSVKIFNQEIVKGKLMQAKVFDSWIPPLLKLNAFQNRIVISFRGIYFTNPDDVSYQYHLKGLDDGFNQAVKVNTIEYPSLLPGTYTFEVKAINSAGIESNIRSITFEIIPPFYKTLAFKALMLILFIAGIVALQYYWNYRKAQQKKLLELIKHEEQLKIRKQTAEDFHDDIGNKVTRITILSDMLNKKLNGENVDEKQIVKQIKENAATLYSGTKDILWALDPQSDDLYEILNHIKDFGTELFQGTGISFAFESIDVKYQALQLPMEYSRNMSLIFKELLSNVLKHAQASEVKFNIHAATGGLNMVLTDNGKGFDTNMHGKGRGLNNIQVRATRINCRIEIQSFMSKGTRANLFIDLNNII